MMIHTAVAINQAARARPESAGRQLRQVEDRSGCHHHVAMQRIPRMRCPLDVCVGEHVSLYMAQLTMQRTRRYNQQVIHHRPVIYLLGHPLRRLIAAQSLLCPPAIRLPLRFLGTLLNRPEALSSGVDLMIWALHKVDANIIARGVRRRMIWRTSIRRRR